MRLAAIAVFPLALCGCLSVCRLGKLAGTRTEWSEERQEWVSHEVQPSGDSDILAKFGLYPTMQMRWQLVRLSCHWAPKRNFWGQHVGLPLTLVGTSPGIAVDVVVDTLGLPWDWKYRNCAPVDMCAPLDEERACRSLCVVCGATSDGEFPRCRSDADRGTSARRRYYGVCPACVGRAKELGYYF